MSSSKDPPHPNPLPGGERGPADRRPSNPRPPGEREGPAKREGEGHRAEEILGFWFGRPGEDHYLKRREIWFKSDAAFDADVRSRFARDYERAASGRLGPWRKEPRPCLALTIVLDQFPRNLFRGDARAFATDGQALALARHALERCFDKDLAVIERMFLYLPFEHSEDLADQRRALTLMRGLGDDETCREIQMHAERHLRTIERFGRFPHRNRVLGRASTPEEDAFLEQEAEGALGER